MLRHNPFVHQKNNLHPALAVTQQHTFDAVVSQPVQFITIRPLSQYFHHSLDLNCTRPECVDTLSYNFDFTESEVMVALKYGSFEVW